MANRGRVEIEATYKDGASQGVDKTTQSVDGLKRTSHDLVSVLGKVAGVFGVSLGAAAMVSFGRDLIMINGAMQDARDTAARLATQSGTHLPTELAKLQQATRGTVSDFKLLETAGKAVQSGLGFDDVATVMEYARLRTANFGGEIKQLTDQIFPALARGSSELKEQLLVLGVDISHVTDNLGGMGEAARRAAIQEAAIAGLREQIATLPEPTEHAALQAERLAAAWENFKVAASDLTEDPAVWGLGWLTAAVEMATKLSGSLPVQFVTTGIKAGPTQAEIDATEAAEQEKALARWVAARDAKFAAESMSVRPEVELDFPADDIIDNFKKVGSEWDDLKDRLIDDGADRQMMQGRVDLANELTRIEFQAAEDRVGLAKWEADQWAAAMRLRVTMTEGSTDELLRIEQARLALISKAEADEQARKQRDLEKEKREVEETRIRRILLIFDADASAVQDSSDLARYSLGLFVDSLRQVSPALSTVVGGIHQVVAGALSNLKEGQSFNLAGGVAAGAGFVVSTGLSMIAADSAKWRAEAARLNQELANARDITGAYARSLESLNIAQQKQSFADLATGLPEQLGFLWKEVDWAQFIDLSDFSVQAGSEFETLMKHLSDRTRLTHQKSWVEAQELTVRTTFEQLARIGEGIGRFSGDVHTFGQAMDDINHLMRLDDVTDPAQKLKMLQDGLAGFIDLAGGLESDFSSLSLQEQRQLKETIADLQRSIAQTEIEAREEQARTVIQSIQRQQVEVQRALDDAQEAQRQALLRSVKLRFDLEETALRAQFFPRLMGAASDPLETDRIMGEMRHEIELLRLQEQAAGTTELARLREAFNAEAQLQQQATDLLVQAVTDAAQVTDMAFRDAVEVQTHELLSGFAAELSGTVLGKPVLPSDLIDMRSQVLLDMGALLAPVGVSPVDLATALRPFGVADVDLRDALELQGVKLVNVGQFFEPAGVRIVELSTALGLSGQQTVELAQALRMAGHVDVSMPDALSVSGKHTVQASNVIDITGRLDVPANQILAMTGVSTQMDTQIAQLRDIRDFTWGANEHLWALRQAGIGTGGGAAVNVDLSTTNQWLREIAQLTATMVQLQFARKSVLSDLDMGALGGFAGFIRMADLIGRNLPSYDVGGTVPGPIGAPQLAMVHGGETIYRPGEGRAVSITIRIDSLTGPITITGGDQGANQAGRVFRDALEPQIINSVRDGAIGRQIQDVVAKAVRRAG